MKEKAIILGLLIAISGCNKQAENANDITQKSHFDSAIENLSITTEQMESIRREKSFLVKVLEDFEEQKTEYGELLNVQRFGGLMQDFDNWHRDISQREKEMEHQHALNVFAAQNQVVNRQAENTKNNVDTAPETKQEQ